MTDYQVGAQTRAKPAGATPSTAGLAIAPPVARCATVIYHWSRYMQNQQLDAPLQLGQVHRLASGSQVRITHIAVDTALEKSHVDGRQILVHKRRVHVHYVGQEADPQAGCAMLEPALLDSIQRGRAAQWAVAT